MCCHHSCTEVALKFLKPLRQSKTFKFKWPPAAQWSSPLPSFPPHPPQQWCSQSAFSIIIQERDKFYLFFPFWKLKVIQLLHPQPMHLNHSLTGLLTVNSGGRMQPERCRSRQVGCPEGSGWLPASPLAPSDHLSPEWTNTETEEAAKSCPEKTIAKGKRFLRWRQIFEAPMSCLRAN